MDCEEHLQSVTGNRQVDFARSGHHELMPARLQARLCPRHSRNGPEKQRDAEQRPSGHPTLRFRLRVRSNGSQRVASTKSGFM